MYGKFAHIFLKPQVANYFEMDFYFFGFVKAA